MLNSFHSRTCKNRRQKYNAVASAFSRNHFNLLAETATVMWHKVATLVCVDCGVPNAKTSTRPIGAAPMFVWMSRRCPPQPGPFPIPCSECQFSPPRFGRACHSGEMTSITNGFRLVHTGKESGVCVCRANSGHAGQALVPQTPSGCRTHGRSSRFPTLSASRGKRRCVFEGNDLSGAGVQPQIEMTLMQKEIRLPATHERWPEEEIS